MTHGVAVSLCIVYWPISPSHQQFTACILDPVIMVTPTSFHAHFSDCEFTIIGHLYGTQNACFRFCAQCCRKIGTDRTLAPDTQCAKPAPAFNYRNCSLVRLLLSSWAAEEFHVFHVNAAPSPLGQLYCTAFVSWDLAHQRILGKHKLSQQGSFIFVQ